MALQEEMEVQGNWLFKRRGTLPVFVLALGILVYILNGRNPKIYFGLNPLMEMYFQNVCLFISFLGLFIRIYTVGFTPANTSGRNTEGQLADTLNTKGIYSIVRHPLYLGNFFMWLGVAMLTAQFWFVIAFILMYWLYYERIMFAEEQFLRKKFGQPYLDWAAITPAFLPRFRQFDRSSLTFCWKKVMKNEKNGLVALFILFMIFDLIRYWMRPHSTLNYFFLAGTLFSGILYLVLKYLKHKTRVLHEVGR